MKKIGLFLSLMLLTVMVIPEVGSADSSDSVDDYYYTMCMDGVTGEAKHACVDWEATQIKCTPLSWPCNDIIIE